MNLALFDKVMKFEWLFCANKIKNIARIRIIFKPKQKERKNKSSKIFRLEIIFLCSDWLKTPMVIGGNKNKNILSLIVFLFHASSTWKIHKHKKIKEGQTNGKNAISFSISRLKQTKEEKLLHHLEMKTNSGKVFSFFCSTRKAEKIKYRWKPLPEKKRGKKKIRNVFHLRQYFFSSLSGWVSILSQVGKSVFHIKIIFALVYYFFFSSAQTTKLLFLLHLMMSRKCTDSLKYPFIFLRTKKKVKDDEKQSRGGWQRRQLELLKVNIFLGTRATLEIEIKQPFYFELWRWKSSPFCHRDGGLGNKIVLLSFNYFTLAVMNRFSLRAMRMTLIFCNDRRGLRRHSGTRNVSARRIYYNFYALFGFIVTIFAKNNYQRWDVLPLISQRLQA